MTVATARKMEVSDLGPGAEHAAEAGERVVLTRKGAPVAAVVSLEDLRRLEAIEAEEDRVDAEALRARQDEPTVPWEQVKSDLGLNGLDMFIAMAGTVRSGEGDVSSDKYRHLGEAYATKP